MKPKASFSNWAHAPAHKLLEGGVYMVTAGTWQRAWLFDTPDKLDLLADEFFRLAEEFGWQPQAWAFMGNHYHSILLSPETPRSLPELIRGLHRATAMRLNAGDGKPGRRVWYQYWDRRLTFPASLYPRLKYVHQNPAHHGLIRNADDYPWCSAGWFKMHADPAFRKTVDNFKTDRLKEYDAF